MVQSNLTVLGQIEPNAEMHFWPGRGASAELVSSPAFRPDWLRTSRGGLHQGLAERGEQARQGNRPAIFRPRLAIHLDAKLAVVAERNPRNVDFEILITFQILDRNTNVCFHKPMIATGLQKSPVHDFMHSQSFIK